MAVFAHIVAGGIFSAAALLWPFLAASGLFRWIGYSGLALGVLLMASTGMPVVMSAAGSGFAGVVDMAIVLFTMGFASLAWMGFVLPVLSNRIDLIAAWGMSDNKLTVRPAYSKAEAAEARGEINAALREYRSLAEDFATDPEPQRRLAECLLRAGRPQEAAQAMVQAIRRHTNPGEKMLLGLRLAEIFSDDIRNPNAAVALLEDLLKRFPEAPGAEFVEERIRILRSR